VHFDVTSPPHIHNWFNLVEDPFFFLWNYGVTYGHVLQASSHVSEWKTSLESSLDSTLTQHPCDKEPKPQEVRAHLEVDPLRAWYSRISSNSHTLVILLQVNPISGDKPEIIYEGCYETKDTSIFTWSSIPDVGHYCWLCSLICQLPFNSKVNYLLCTIQRILDFL